MKLFLAQPHLFSGQFDSAKWLFVPLCALGHWLLATVDLKSKKIQMYNSLGGDQDDNEYWFQPHVNKMHWVKYFLSWTLGQFFFTTVILLGNHDIKDMNTCSFLY